MAKKQMAKLRQMSPEDLAAEEEQLRAAVWKLRLQQTTGQLQDPHKVQRARQELARLLTEKRQRELVGEAGR